MYLSKTVHLSFVGGNDAVSSLTICVPGLAVADGGITGWALSYLMSSGADNIIWVLYSSGKDFKEFSMTFYCILGKVQPFDCLFRDL